MFIFFSKSMHFSTVMCICFETFQMGAYHTLDLELNRPFTLAKSEWDSVVLQRIGENILDYFFIDFFQKALDKRASFRSAYYYPWT